MRKAAAILVILTAGALVFSQSQVSVSASPVTATIGDRIILKFLVRTPAGSDSIRILPGKPEYEVLKEYGLNIHSDKDIKTYEKNYDIAFFDTGDFTAGPFTIELIRNGSVIEELRSNEIKMTIRSVLEEEDRDIKPLKDLKEIEGNPLHLLKYVFLLILLTGVILFIRYFIKRLRTKPAPEPIPPLPPEDELRERIDSLWRSGLLDRGRFKPFFLSLTEAYKNFMRRFYGFNAEDLTTYEITLNLRTSETDASIVKGFEDVFLISDLSKFARYIPAGQEMETIRNTLYAIISRVRQRREEEQAGVTDDPH